MRLQYLILYPVIVILATVFWSCASAVDVTKPFGEKVLISFDNNKVSTAAELISIDDSSFVYLHDDTFHLASFDSLEKIYVTDYQVHLRGISIFSSILIDGLIAYSTMATGERIWLGVLAIAHAIFSALHLHDQHPEVQFDYPLSQADIVKLRAFSRYPTLKNDDVLRLRNLK